MLYLVITLPADDLAPSGARSSAGKVMTSHTECFIINFLAMSDFKQIFIDRIVYIPNVWLD